MSRHNDDEFPVAANIVVGVGIAFAIVLSTWMTIIVALPIALLFRPRD